MQKKQQLIYGARIRMGWFMEAKKLGSVTEARKRLGVPRRTYYFITGITDGKRIVKL